MNLAFERCRGHPIERRNYLEDLRRASWIRKNKQGNGLKSNEGKESTDPFQAQIHPEYKNEEFEKHGKVGTNEIESTTKFKMKTDALTLVEQQCITNQLLDSNFDDKSDK